MYSFLFEFINSINNKIGITDCKPEADSKFTYSRFVFYWDAFNVREGDYFNYVQPFQHHTNVPVHNSINVYSFALKPEDHQPSGTLNMSRIDTATLMVTAGPRDTGLTYEGVNIYAVNYNVLRILSGMGGLAYSN